MFRTLLRWFKRASASNAAATEPQKESSRTSPGKQDDRLKRSAGPQISLSDQYLIAPSPDQRSLVIVPSHQNPAGHRENHRNQDKEIVPFTPISPVSPRSPYTPISPFFSSSRNSRSMSHCSSPMREESMPPGEALNLTGQVFVPANLPLFEGTYSSIHKGEYAGREVAVKSIRTVKDAESMRIKIREAVAKWWYVRHPNVLGCFGYAEDSGFGDFGAIISPWCNDGDSSSYLAQGRPLAQRFKMFLEVAKGLQYLHQSDIGIVHGDLKPVNILIDNEETAKIADYDLITRITQDEFVTGKTITPAYTNTVRYLAYELVEDGRPPSKASDVYALGCIGYEFIYSQHPYAQIRNGHANAHYKICKAIGRGVPPATRPSNLSTTVSGLWDLLEACWDNDPEKRPEAGDVVRYLEQHAQAVSDTLNL